jgi:hypothetical protein
MMQTFLTFYRDILDFRWFVQAVLFSSAQLVCFILK